MGLNWNPILSSELKSPINLCLISSPLDYKSSTFRFLSPNCPILIDFLEITTLRLWGVKTDWDESNWKIIYAVFWKLPSQWLKLIRVIMFQNKTFRKLRNFFDVDFRKEQSVIFFMLLPFTFLLSRLQHI